MKMWTTKRDIHDFAEIALKQWKQARDNFIELAEEWQEKAVNKDIWVNN